MSKYKLVIVESPKKAKSIGNYLGPEYKVTSSKGHIIDLPKNDIGIDVDDNFNINQKVIVGKEDVVKSIQQLAENASEIYLASDPDREGEAIAFHLKSIIKNKKKVNIHRAVFHEITPGAVKLAIENPQELNQNMYESQKTRRILDRLVGYKISPILWKKITPGLSAGRVQSVALRIIVEREDAIAAFVPEQWFSIDAFLESGDKKFGAKFFGLDLTSKQVLNKAEEANSILENIKNKPFITEDVEFKEVEQRATPPFTTSQLQQEAITKLGFSAKQAMQVAQRLYEGVSIEGKGTQGLITYMRTDSTRTSPSALESLRVHIKATYGDEYLASETILHGSKKGNTKIQDAHEAIRPTSIEFTPQSIQGYLSDEEYKLYSLIWNKFVASQMSNCKIAKTTISFKVDNKYIFKSSGSVTLFEGFKKVFEDTSNEKKNKKGDDDQDLGSNLPLLKNGDEVVQEKNAVSSEKWTSPPPRFTAQALIATLEKKGIGRPSTYVAILGNIETRGYVKIINKRYQPTDIGTVLCKLLILNFPEQMDIKFTANVEKQLDLIEDGQEVWTEVLQKFWDSLANKLKDSHTTMPDIKPKGIPSGICCPNCSKSDLVLAWNGSKQVVNCPSCSHQEGAIISAPGLIELTGKPRVENPCPKCASELKERTGKYGPFMSCSNYPACNYIGAVSTKVKCYLCKKGEFVIKQSKKGNTFYSCDQYPTCKNMLWGYPLEEKCVHCLNPILELKEYKGEKYKVCPKCNKKN